MDWERIIKYGIIAIVAVFVNIVVLASGYIMPLMTIATAILILRAVTVIVYEVFKGIKEGVNKSRRKKNDNLWIQN